MLDSAHKHRLAFPSLEKNIAVSRESRALSATVSSRPPRNPSCTYHVCSRIATFPPRIYGVPRARLRPSRRCSPPSTRPTSPVFRPQVPRADQKYLIRLHLCQCSNGWNRIAFLRVSGRKRPVLANPQLALVRQEALPLGSMKITHLELFRFLR